MGRTPTPLVIWADPDYTQHPKLKEAAEKGHTVLSLGDLEGVATLPDLIVSRSAWRWMPEMWEGTYWEVALKAARANKKTKDNPAKVKKGK